jgi:integrase
MAREIHKLTPAMVAAATPGRHPDGGGLYLQATPSGASWLFRFVYRGKENNMGLGKVDMGRLSESLATARGKADAARRHLIEGRNPLEARRDAEAAAADAAKPKAPLFRDAAAEFMRVNRVDWKSKVHKEQWRTTLERYAYPTIGDTPVDRVTVQHIRDILEPLWRAKNETARRVRGRIEMILDREAGLGNRSLADNPARVQIVRQLLGKSRPRKRHHPAVPYKQLPGLMGKIGGNSNVASLALRWLVLTACRSVEGRGAMWEEIDKAGKRWVIPAERMKGGEEHVVPLSAAALEVLDAVAKIPRVESPYIFVAQGSKPISDTSLRDVLRAHGITKEKGSLHGMRSSFRDWCAENGIDEPVAEACLAHAVDDKVIAAYRRTKFTEMRAEVMARWGMFVWE